MKFQHRAHLWPLAGKATMVKAVESDDELSATLTPETLMISLSPAA